MTDKYRRFLDDLRDCGMLSMFAAERYLMEAFPLRIGEARTIALEWLETKPFGET